MTAIAEDARRLPSGRRGDVTDQTTERFATSGGLEGGPILAGAVLGHGFFRMSPGDVPAVRRRPGPVPEGSTGIAPSVLRYSDEQSVAATAATLAAIERMDLPRSRYVGWGVVAASRYLGRANLAVALRNFLDEGVWGTSPHLIPHFALHSPAGTISLALGLHGPNIGVGGGLHAAAEGFLAALTWISAGSVPGVWLVLSGWSPELVPDRRGDTAPIGECQALAIALVAGDGWEGRWALRAVVGAGRQHAAAPLDLVRLAETLEGGRGATLPRSIATDPSGRLRVDLIKRTDGLGN
jgi:hypothetical protein